MVAPKDTLRGGTGSLFSDVEAWRELFSHSDEAPEINDDIDAAADIFIADYVQAVGGGAGSIAQQPVHIDGQIDSFEEMRLAKIAFEKICEYKKKYPELKWDKITTTIKSLARLENLASETAPGDCVTIRISADEIRALKEACRFILPSLVGVEALAVSYLLKELDSAADSMDMLTGEIYLMPDLRVESGFNEFVLQCNTVLPDEMTELKTIPFDYVCASRPNSPTVFVFCDEHFRSSTQLAVYHDMSLIADKMGATFAGVEGSALGEKWEWMPRADEIDADADLAEMIKLAKGYFIDAARREDFMVDYYERNDGKENLLSPEIIARLTGEGVSYTPIGVESPDMVAAGGMMATWASWVMPDVPADLIETLMTIGVRSQTALENTVRLMQENSTTTGVLRFGLGHYASLKAEAMRRGDVNVIFMRPPARLDQMP